MKVFPKFTIYIITRGQRNESTSSPSSPPSPVRHKTKTFHRVLHLFLSDVTMLHPPSVNARTSPHYPPNSHSGKWNSISTSARASQVTGLGGGVQLLASSWRWPWQDAWEEPGNLSTSEALNERRDKLCRSAALRGARRWCVMKSFERSLLTACSQGRR